MIFSFNNSLKGKCSENPFNIAKNQEFEFMSL